MDPVDAVVLTVAVLAPAAYVLRDLTAADRPADGPVAAPEPAFAEPAPELVVAPVLGVGTLPAAAPVEVAATLPGPLADPRAVPPPPAPVAETVAGRVAEPVVAPPAEPAAEPEPVAAVLAEPEAEPEPVASREVTGSMLAGLSSTETEEHTALRRVGALVLLLGVTAAAAAMVAAGIYRAVAALG